VDVAVATSADPHGSDALPRSPSWIQRSASPWKREEREREEERKEIIGREGRGKEREGKRGSGEEEIKGKDDSLQLLDCGCVYAYGSTPLLLALPPQLICLGLKLF